MSKAMKLFEGNAPTTEVSALRALGAARNSGGDVFLKFASRGDGWEYGSESIPVEDDELWAINPNTFEVGVIGWQDGAVVGEEMYPISSGQRVDRAELATIPASADPNQNNGWQDQITVRLRALEDGTEVMFKTTTHGGLSAITDLAGACADQGDTNAEYGVPVVRLKRDSYKHKKHGRMFTPKIEIDHWVDMNGQAAKKRRNLS